MGLPKGRTNNPHGRKRGSRNKNLEDIRSFVEGLINDNRAQIKLDMANLEPEKRLQIWERMLSYVLPKLQAIEAKMEFNQLSDEQIDTIIAELTKNIE